MPTPLNHSPKKVHYISMAAANPTQRSGDNQKKSILGKAEFAIFIYSV